MKKILALILAGCLLVFGLTACGNNEDTSGGSSAPKTTSAVNKADNIRLVTIKGPAGVAMVNLLEKNKNKETAFPYTVDIVNTAEEAVNKLTSGDADIAALPTNVAAALYKRLSGDVRMLATTMTGVLHIVENGTSIGSVSDLKGKTIYTMGQAANPEYVLRHVLKQNGVDPDKDVTIEFAADNDTLAALLAAGTAKIAMVPEPLATTVRTKNEAIRTVFDVSELWAASESESELIMSCAVADKDFVADNPGLISAFLTELKESIALTSENIDQTAALCESFEIIPKAALAKAAIPGCNLLYRDGADMKSHIKGYFEVLFNADAKSVGGAVPDDEFYYNAA